MLAGGKHTYTKVARRSRDGGIVRIGIITENVRDCWIFQQPLSQKSKIFDSSPYTGEPLAEYRNSSINRNLKGNIFCLHCCGLFATIQLY